MNTKTNNKTGEDNAPRVKYLETDPVLIYKPLRWQKLGLQQTASGYGAKLTTSQCVKVDGRLRRVYASCYGNAGSAWIILNGEKIHLRG